MGRLVGILAELAIAAWLITTGATDGGLFGCLLIFFGLCWVVGHPIVGEG